MSSRDVDSVVLKAERLRSFFWNQSFLMVFTRMV